MGDGTHRITVRVDGDLYDSLREYTNEHEVTQSQLVRRGIRRELDGSDDVGVDSHPDLSDALDRLERVTDDVTRQTARLERLPLK